MKKIFPLWAEEKEIKKIKQKAKENRQSASQFILKKTLDMDLHQDSFELKNGRLQ